jgi:hypothetical protein
VLASPASLLCTLVTLYVGLWLLCCPRPHEQVYEYFVSKVDAMTIALDRSPIRCVPLAASAGGSARTMGKGCVSHIRW